MASDDSDSGDSFHRAMDRLVESIRVSLSPELHALVGSRLFEGQSTVPADPADALKVLSKFLKLSAKPCSAEVKTDVGNSILDKSDPVNLFFSCLPSPESHEMRPEIGGRGLINAYHHAHEVLKYFTLVHGRNKLMRQYKDTFLNNLFEILDRADESVSLRYFRWSENLLRLIWEVPRGIKIQRKHTAETQNLIQYLRWVILGRKNSLCTDQKPWATVDPAELRRRADDDLSRLPDNALPGNCANCSVEGAVLRCTCYWLDPKRDNGAGTVYCNVMCREGDSGRHAVSHQETIELSRRTILFQIGFVQYLLSINHEVSYTVSAEDGMVRVFFGDTAPSDLNPATTYEGVSPDLDLSLPKVEAALHAFGCCAIEDPARALLEYFFRSSSTWIKFLDFVPKNAHIPVLEKFRNGRTRFNMSPRHTVAILRTNSGLQFVLDPTAAQYGWKENIAPRGIYAQCRIDHELDTTACLAPSSPSPRTEHTLRPEGESELATWKHKCVAEDIVDVVKDHFSANGGLQYTLQLPQHQFEEQCQALRETLKSGMRTRDGWRDFCEKHGAVRGVHS